MKSDNTLDRPWMRIAGSDDPGDPNEPERQDSALIALGNGSRRSFLKGLGLSGALSLAACQRRAVEHAIPLLIGTEGLVPGVPVFYASTCSACPSACGLMTTVRDGRPIKLEGHKEHPLSQGGLCARGQADIRSLYDAGRLRAPRLLGKDSDWKSVDAHVTAKLAEVRASASSVYVVSPTIVSPTARRAIAGFVKSVGGQLVEYDAGTYGTSAILSAYERLDGTAVLPSFDLQAADFLLAIDADPFASGPDVVVHTAQYAQRREACGDGRGDFMHVQVEGNLSLTGASSDQRIQATTAEQRNILLGVLQEIAGHNVGAAANEARSLTANASAGQWSTHVKALAKSLRRFAGRSLVMCGSRDQTMQLGVALLNRILGNEGKTLNLTAPSSTRRGRDEAMAAFRAALEAGRVGAAFLLDANPVEELPNGAGMAKLLKALPLAVAISSRPTATVDACTVVAAAHHGLEQWGDASPRRDVLTVLQPSTRPLFNTRHPILSVLRWAGSTTADYRTYLKSTWKQLAFASASDVEFEARWSQIVASGPADPSVAKRLSAALDREIGVPAKRARSGPLAAAEVGAADELEVGLLEEVGLLAGGFGYNPWIRELPDPLTRVSWHGVVRLAPAFARQHSIVDGDLVDLVAGQITLQFPARILPGQHPKVIGVPVGYGQKDGDGGVPARNGHRLRGHAGKVQVRKTGRHEKLPLIQVHPSSEGRNIIHQVHSTGGSVPPAHAAGLGLAPDRKYSPHWQMAINLDACTGCSACVVACQAENNIPVVGPEGIRDHRDMNWLRMDRYFAGPEDDPEVMFEPMMCAQCDNAPCEMVCPVAATVHSADGLNHQAYNRCVGTRYCANNCPYKVRRFNWFDYTPKDPIERLVLNPDVVVRDRGVMEKCTFCVQRIQLARIEAKKSGSDEPLQVQTACQQSCPAQAITFGDGSDEQSEVSQKLHGPRAFQALADLGIKPSITYLARVRRRDKDKKGGGHP